MIPVLGSRRRPVFAAEPAKDATASDPRDLRDGGGYLVPRLYPDGSVAAPLPVRTFVSA